MSLFNYSQSLEHQISSLRSSIETLQKDNSYHIQSNPSITKHRSTKKEWS